MTIRDFIGSILRITPNSKLIIWGGGVRGLKLLDSLQKLHLDVYAFADHDEMKQKVGIKGLRCFSKTQLLNLATTNDLCIIVSPGGSDDLYADLLLEFPNVFSNELCGLILSAGSLEDGCMLPSIGHYYSLYPDLRDIKSRESIIYDKSKSVLDIDLQEENQKQYFMNMLEMYPSIPKWGSLEGHENSKFRYQYHNGMISAADAVALHCMLRLLKPKKIIEVGSGWSSAVFLDTNEFYLDHSINMTFIEPYPQRLNAIQKEADDIYLINKNLQEVSYTVFEDLEAGDILFVDSSHVSKIGSDVNYLFFEILPRLKSGVYIHFHDIFYPFEYPKDWTFRGTIWNELYLLRAFLQNNKEYTIVYFQNMIQQKFGEIIAEAWSLEEDFQGGSFYMKKL